MEAELVSERRGSVAGLINETPIICGGYYYYDSCIVFGQTKTSIKMNEPRYRATSVVLNETTLWIMGGYIGSSRLVGNHNVGSSYRLSSTEFITLDSSTSVNGPALPNGLSHSCAFKYNDTHSYLTGGLDDSGITNKVLIFNTILDAGSSSWTEGPRMNHKRVFHGCTVLHHCQKTWVVVAGGFIGNQGGHLDGNGPKNSVEILDPNKNKWVQG